MIVKIGRHHVVLSQIKSSRPIIARPVLHTVGRSEAEPVLNIQAIVDTQGAAK
jgi:hypothetical protein